VDPVAALKWLERAFGFDTSMFIMGRSGVYRADEFHAEMRLGAGVVMIGGEWTDTHKSPRSAGGVTTQTVHLDKDVDAHCARARSRRHDPCRALRPVLWRSHLPCRGSRGSRLVVRTDGEAGIARASRGGERAQDRRLGVSQSAAGIDRTLAALADPHRRRVIELLRERPHRAGELAQRTGLALPAMSRHLRQLREGGLVAESHPAFDARVRIYALDPKPIAALKHWLEETEALWSTQLEAFKHHVERVS